MATPGPSSDAVFDVDRINAVFQSEVEGYLENLTFHFISERSANCGSLVGWFCVLAPEALSDQSKSKLFATWHELKMRPDYELTGWFQELPLQIAAYGLDRDPYHLRSHIENLSLGGSGWGWEIMESLALVIHELDIGDERLRLAGEAGLPHRQAFCEVHAAMVLMARGQKEVKVELLNGWLKKYRLNPRERDYLERLAAGESVRNDFVYPFFRQQSYILDRLCRAESIPSGSGEDATLFDMRPKVRLLERIRSHPLMQYHLRIAST